MRNTPWVRSGKVGKGERCVCVEKEKEKESEGEERRGKEGENGRRTSYLYENRSSVKRVWFLWVSTQNIQKKKSAHI